jgi:periplasmic divalent cation tolerance protein
VLEQRLRHRRVPQYRVLIVSTNEKVALDPDFDVVLVLTTLGAGGDADAIARTLVDERLAACVNILPVMTSMYRWQGRIEQDQERQLICKTTRQRLGALEQRLRQLHPYELPEFLVLSASEGSEAYVRWVKESTKVSS